MRRRPSLVAPKSCGGSARALRVRCKRRLAMVVKMRNWQQWLVLCEDVLDHRALDSYGSTPRPAPRWRPRPHVGVRAPLPYNTTFRYDHFQSTVLTRLRRARTVLAAALLRSEESTSTHGSWLT
eukprot:scaffold90403_cov62-Phaeocystis_antarctica.AAC.1